MNTNKQILLGVVAAFTLVLFLPVLSVAGSLEPSAAPGPTMKTLDQIPPAWSQKISGAARFELVLDGAAVLDKETGLVWEQSPDIIPATWYDAIYICALKEVGGRKGWHLPTVEQLASLVDTSVSGSPKLPAGHPFTNVQSSIYWSATTIAEADNTSAAWPVAFGTGGIHWANKTSADYYVWCVRGGQNIDGY